jgi:hypothetical protein
MREGV